MGGETQVSFLGAFPTPDFGLCLSQQISIEVNMLLPGLNGCLSRMRLHLVTSSWKHLKKMGAQSPFQGTDRLRLARKTGHDQTPPAFI